MISYVEHPHGGFFLVDWSETEGKFLAQRVTKAKVNRSALVDYVNLSPDEEEAVNDAWNRALNIDVQEQAASKLTR